MCLSEFRLELRLAARRVLARLAMTAHEGMVALSYSPAGEAAFRAASASFSCWAGPSVGSGTRNSTVASLNEQEPAMLVLRLLTCDPWADRKASPVTCSSRCMAALRAGAVACACQARTKNDFICDALVSLQLTSGMAPEFFRRAAGSPEPEGTSLGQ